MKKLLKKHDMSIPKRLDAAIKAPFVDEDLLVDARDLILLLEREISALRSALYDACARS